MTGVNYMPGSREGLAVGAVVGDWTVRSLMSTSRGAVLYRADGPGGPAVVKEYYPTRRVMREAAQVVPRTAGDADAYESGLRAFLDAGAALLTLGPEVGPGLVRTRSLVEANGTAYLVMDAVEGEPLAKRLAAGERFDQPALDRLIRRLAPGLAALHRTGLRHGAITPDEILIDAGGDAVLVGLGHVDDGDPMAASRYAPIEQYAPVHPQGPWSDIYALGAVLAHAATGTPPVEALHRQGALRLTSGEAPGFDPAFLHAIEAATDVAPQRRPPSIDRWLSMFPVVAAVPASAVPARPVGPAVGGRTFASAEDGVPQARVANAPPGDGTQRRVVPPPATAPVSRPVPTPEPAPAAAPTVPRPVPVSPTVRDRSPRTYLAAAALLVIGSGVAMTLLSQPGDDEDPPAAVRPLASNEPDEPNEPRGVARQAAPAPATRPASTDIGVQIAAQREAMAGHVGEGNRLLQFAERDAVELDRLRSTRAIAPQWGAAVEAQRQLLDAHGRLIQASRQLATTSDAGEAERLVVVGAAARAAIETQRARIAALVTEARQAPPAARAAPVVEAPPRPAAQPRAAEPVRAAPPPAVEPEPAGGGDPPRALLARADRILDDLFSDYDDLRGRIRRSYDNDRLAHAVKRRAYRQSLQIHEELIALRNLRNRIARTDNFQTANRRYDELAAQATRISASMEAVRRSL